MLTLLLFFHILAVLGLSAGITLELVGLVYLQRADTFRQARMAMCHSPIIGGFMAPSGVLLLGTGVGLVYAGGFGWAPWNVTAALIAGALMIVGPTVNASRLHALHAACEDGDGNLSATVCAMRRNALTNFIVFFTVTIIVALLFVMVTKPELPGCLAAISVAIAVSAALAAKVASTGKQPATTTA